MVKCKICQMPVTTMVIGMKGVEELAQKTTKHLRDVHEDIVRSMTELLAMLPATAIMISLFDKFEIEDTASNMPILEHRERTMERMQEVLTKLGVMEEDNEDDDDDEDDEIEEDELEGYEDSPLPEGNITPINVTPET